MNLPNNFVDVHGLSYPNGIMVITRMYINRSTNSGSRLEKVDGTWQTVTEPENNHNSVGFAAGIFVDQAAMDAGLQPVPVVDQYGNSDFHLSVQELPEDFEAICALCRQHALDRLSGVEPDE